MCGLRRQIIDCQFGPTSHRTRRGLLDPAACAVLRFNVLIVSAIANIATHSDFGRCRQFRCWLSLLDSMERFWGHLDILGDGKAKVRHGASLSNGLCAVLDL